MASDDGVAMPTGVKGEVESPNIPSDQSNQDETPLHNLSEAEVTSFPGDTNRSFYEGQFDGVTDDPDTGFDRHPNTPERARAQGIAWLRIMLNDPKGEIAEEIFKTRGFKGQHSSNERCRTVRGLFTGEKAVDDKSVPYVLATWCMLAGAVPAIWRESHDKSNGYTVKPLTTWGKEMLEDLGHLSLAKTSELKHCKDYGKGIAPPSLYNTAEARKELDAMANRPKQKKKKPPTASSSGNPVKHVASSPRQSPATKRTKITTTEQPNEVVDLSTHNDRVGTPKRLESISEDSRRKLHEEKRGSGFKVPASSGPATSSEKPRNGSLPSSFTKPATKALPSTRLATVQHDNRNGGRDQHSAPQNENPSTNNESRTVDESAEDVNLGEDLEMIQRHANSLNQQVADKISDLKQQVADKKKLQQQVNDLKQQVAEKDKLQKQVNDLKKQVAEKEKQIEAAKKNNRGQGSMGELETKIAKLEAKVKELNCTKQSYVAVNSDLSAQVKRQQEILDDLAGKNPELKRFIQERED